MGLLGLVGRAVLNLRTASREDVDSLCTELADAGYTVSQPPFDAFWGSRYAIVNDPDGHPVGLKSEPDPEKRSRPPTL